MGRAGCEGGGAGWVVWDAVARSCRVPSWFGRSQALSDKITAARNRTDPMTGMRVYLNPQSPGETPKGGTDVFVTSSPCP